MPLTWLGAEAVLLLVYGIVFGIWFIAVLTGTKKLRQRGYSRVTEFFVSWILVSGGSFVALWACRALLAPLFPPSGQGN